MSNRFEVQDTPIKDLRVLVRRPVGDHRGYLERMFCAAELESVMVDGSLVQINHTVTAQKGTVRGMHFQHPPHAEMKLISCLRGEIFDVAVDLRAGSPTFLQWHGERLSAENHKTLVVPEGFAHGFKALTDNCAMLYMHTEFYRPGHEDGINCSSPAVGVNWPLAVTEMSERDRSLPAIERYFGGIEL